MKLWANSLPCNASQHIILQKLLTAIKLSLFDKNGPNNQIVLLLMITNVLVRISMNSSDILEFYRLLQ